MKKYFDVLGLHENASQEAIQEAYDRLSIKLHPEKNENQVFFVEEYEKIQEAYNALRNSSILATEKGINNSNLKPISFTNSNKNKKELNKEPKKINIFQGLIKEKKKITLFIIVSIFVKIVIHFFIFPTETLILNTDKKVFVAKSEREIRIIKRGYGDNDFNGNKLIVFGDSVFYYPKEKVKVSIEEHIYMTFTERVWLFPCIIILLLSLFWINNKADIENNKKQNFSSHFSKLNIIIILLLSLSIVSNVYLFIKINNGNDPVLNSSTTLKSPSLSMPTLKIPNEIDTDGSNYAEDAQIYMNNAEDYMNNAEEYMNSAEEYMNNAARSAQEAEEYANNR